MTGADIDIQDDGTVFIGSHEGEGADEAARMIDEIANPRPVLVGERYDGKVVKTTTFGAFVNLVPGRDGLVHISKLGRGKRLTSVEEAVQGGRQADGRWSRTSTPGQDQPEAGRRGVGRPRGRQVDVRRASGETAAASPGRGRGSGARPRAATPRRGSATRGEALAGEPSAAGAATDEPIARTEFSSGLRVVTERMPGVRSVSLGFWVLAGSRDERPRSAVQPLPRAPAVQGHRRRGPRTTSPRTSTRSAAT